MVLSRCIFLPRPVTLSISLDVSGFRSFIRLFPIHHILHSLPAGIMLLPPLCMSHLKCYSVSTTEKHQELNFLSLQTLHACKDLHSLRMVHATILCSGLNLKHYAQKLLISMYVGFGYLSSTVAVLKTLPEADARLWNLVLNAHIDSGLFEMVLYIFNCMRQSGVRPDHYTFPLINRAIITLHGCLELGEAAHCLCVRMGLGVDIYFCNTMIEVYLRCNYIGAAHLLFDEMYIRDVVSWTSMISGYVRSGDISASFRLFQKMQTAGFQPNTVTLLVILQVCSNVEHVTVVKQFHAFAIKGGFDNLEEVRNSMLTAFSKIGHLEDAEKIFNGIDKRDLVAWNIMTSCYSQVGHISKVLECFNKMRVELLPSHETFTLVISACTKSREMLIGRMFHCHVLKSGLVDDVLQACLIDFYAKFGELETSVCLFEEVREKNVTLWSTMMYGFVQAGFFGESITLFHKMQVVGIEVGPDILMGILLACANLGSLRLGKGVHKYLLRNRWSSAGDMICLQTSLMNMYARCGSLLLAERCFNQIIDKDVVAWSSMIECFAIHGIGLEAVKLFYQMQGEGVSPNSVTFLSVLSACSHSGLVAEGCKVFYAMSRKCGIEPELNHYTCIVDLLGRAGKLEQALGVINNMKVEPDGRIWGALLSSCRTYCETNLGTYAAQKLFNLEPENVGYHVVLCNIHASAERWGDAENMRKFVDGSVLKKEPGWSCIEVGLLCHKFVAGHRSHPKGGEIYEVLGCLARHIEGMEVYNLTAY